MAIISARLDMPELAIAHRHAAKYFDDAGGALAVEMPHHKARRPSMFDDGLPGDG